jgi:hypothetical protein
MALEKVLIVNEIIIFVIFDCSEIFSSTKLSLGISPLGISPLGISPLKCSCFISLIQEISG